MTKRTRHHAGRDQNEGPDRELPGPGQALIGFQEPESSLFGVPLPTSSLFGVPQPTNSLFGVPQQVNRPDGANGAPTPPRPRSPQDDYRRQQALLLANQRAVPAPARRRSWPALLGLPLAVLLLGIALGVIVVVMLLAAGVPAPWAHSPAHARSASALPRANSPASVDPASVGSAPAALAPVDPAPHPATSIGKPGTYLVGTQLRAGRYTTDGGVSCYWARLRDVDGVQTIVAEGNGDGRTTVLIRKADSAFRTSGCTVWTRR
jgi:hypothetical protein